MTIGTRQERIPLSEPVFSGNEWRYVKECLDTGWVSSVGSFVDRFEEMVAQYIGVSHAVAVVNGTAALHLSLIVTGVKEGDEVLVPALTFIAPVNTVKYVGAHPVFFDCDPTTLCIDVDGVRAFLETRCGMRDDGFMYNKKTGRRVSAIIPVHVFGHPCDMDPLMELCKEHNIRVIEDATESLGSTYKGTQGGALGDMGCLSFNGNKIITTGGGGMIVTNNTAWAQRARHLSTQAKSDPFTHDHDAIGYNYRLTNIQAAVGVAQMEKLDQYIAIKRRNAGLYREALDALPGVSFVSEQSWATSNFWFYTLSVPSKIHGALIQYLVSQGMQARPVWKPIHTLSMYRQYATGEFRNAEQVYTTHFNLPCSVSLTEKDIAHVIESIRSYYTQNL